MKKVVLLLFACCMILQAKATLVIPPKNIDEMGKMADLVVYGQVSNYVSGDPFFNHFVVQKIIKGDAGVSVGEPIVVREYSSSYGEYVSRILGDVDFKMNTPYLLFLERNDNGYYTSSIVAMSVFEETTLEGREVLIHPSEFLDICFTKEVRPNLRGAYDSKMLMEYLSNSLTEDISWNMAKAGYLGDVDEYITTDFEQPNLLSNAACPNTIASGVDFEHCTTVIGETMSLNNQCTINSPGKFPDNNWSVAVITQGSMVNGDPVADITSEFADMANAVDLLNTLEGININTTVSNRACNFICPTVNASVFPPVVTNPGTFAACGSNDNEILVLLNNPCTNVNIPSSILGFGGAFAANTGREADCHTDRCCNKWKTNLRPYVVLNNTAGAGGSYRFTAALAHEMLHACGLGHTDGSCTALMNPMLCNTNNATNESDFGLTNLDEACTEWMYVRSGVTNTSPCVPIVPVELTAFEGAHTNGINHLEWHTSSEINNSHFEVERSVDGHKFEVIGKVFGAGTTVEEQQYSFVDIDTKAKLYYRLKQVDFDGEFDYSEMIVLYMDKEEWLVNAYPSPAKDVLNISSNHDVTKIELIGINGQLLMEQYPVSANEIAILQVSQLVAGTYFIRLQSERNTLVKRFFKH